MFSAKGVPKHSHWLKMLSPLPKSSTKACAGMNTYRREKEEICDDDFNTKLYKIIHNFLFFYILFRFSVKLETTYVFCMSRYCCC